MQKRYKDMEFSQVDGLFAVALLVCGFLFWDWISPLRPGIGTTAFCVVICLVTGFYLNKKGYRQNRRSVICLGMILLFAMVFLVFDSYLEKNLNLLLVMVLFIYWVALTAGTTIESRLSGYVLVDLPHQIFAKGFASFPSLPAILLGTIKKKKSGKRIAGVLIGIAVMIPVLYVVISLLISADMAFETLMKKMSQLISQDILIYIWYFILGIPVAFYLCSLIWGNVMKRPTAMTKEQVDKSLGTLRFAPASTVYAALSMLNLVYVIFFVSQAAYLFSAFENALPEGMTYAAYARRGFFELCAVAAINLVLIALAYLLIRKTGGRILKIQMILLSIFTMLLTATGISKMILYIGSYGLTRLRIYTSVFMIMLFLVFLIILLRQVITFNGSRAVIIAVLICFAGLCCGNVDGQIAKYNMDQYLKGNLELMDAEEMWELSSGAIPYFYEAYKKTEDEKARAELYTAITGDSLMYGGSNEKDDSFKTSNLQSYRAQKIREEVKKTPPPGWEELKKESRKAAKKVKPGYYCDTAKGDITINLDEDGTFLLIVGDENAEGRYTEENNRCVLHLYRNETGLEDEAIDGAVFEINKKDSLILTQDMGKVLKKGSVLAFEA